MTFDPTAQNVGVGGMVFLTAMWLLLKYKPWKNDGNGKHTSAGLTAAEWKTAINEEVKKALAETAPYRHQELRKLMVDVLENEFRSRNETLRKMMSEILKTRGR